MNTLHVLEGVQKALRYVRVVAVGREFTDDPPLAFDMPSALGDVLFRQMQLIEEDGAGHRTVPIQDRLPKTPM